MAEDKTEKAAKTTEKREIIGTVKGISDEGKTLKIKIEESDGSSWDWKSFHASEWRGKVEYDKTYRFAISLVMEEGRQYPWRNLDKLLGPAEMPSSGEMTSRPVSHTGGPAKAAGGGGAGGGRSMDQTIVTRNSIEAGNAANIVIELLKLGTSMVDMPSAIEDVLANADSIIDWMSGHWVELSPSRPTTNGVARKPAAKESKGNAAKATDDPKNLGELLNTCIANWNLKRQDVEKIIEMDASDITDFNEALQRVGFEMERNSEAPVS